MKIEEWLDKRIEDTEKNCHEKHLDSYDNGYFDGYYDALDDLLRELPLFEHEVTLREVKEECDKHGGEEGCYGCVLLREPKFPSQNYCAADCSPNAWDIDDIERRMKEAGK